MVRSARGAAAEAGDSDLVRVGARVGYAASGVLHLLLAWLALRLAWGGSGEQVDQSGAFGQLAGTPGGSVLLWVLIVGFVLLALWQATEAVAGHETTARVKSAGKAVVYGVLAVTAFGVVTGSGGGGGAEGLTSELMTYAPGRVLVGLVGVGVVAVGGYHVVKGWRRKFLDDLRRDPGRAAEVLGRLGYVAKGVALAVVGVLFVVAAVQARPEQAQGLDGALRTLLDLPLGKVLLTAVALGLAAYGVYSFVRARHAKV